MILYVHTYIRTCALWATCSIVHACLLMLAATHLCVCVQCLTTGCVRPHCRSDEREEGQYHEQDRQNNEEERSEAFFLWNILFTLYNMCHLYPILNLKCASNSYLCTHIHTYVYSHILYLFSVFEYLRTYLRIYSYTFNVRIFTFVHLHMYVRMYILYV